MINVFQPALGDEELAAIREVFASNWIGKGDQVAGFECAFAESLKERPDHFISTTSCTEGIFLASLLFGFGPGDEVIIPSVHFVAVANSVLASGAQPVFCDVDPRTLNATATLIEKKITPRTKAVFLNHYGGVPCDMAPIMDLCSSHDIFVIEDSACAVNSFYQGRAAGTWGDMGIWSFDAMKTICTGDGGMIYVRDPQRVEAAKELLYLGLPNRQKSGIDSSTKGAATWWEFNIQRPGRRSIMNNIAGAIGMVQMKKLPEFLDRRRQIHDFYDRELAGLDWLDLPPPVPVSSVSSNYFYWIQLERRNELALFLKERGIYTTFRYWPLHKVDYFAQWSLTLPNAERSSQTTLNLPMHQSLSDDDLRLIVDSIRKFR